MKTQHTKGPWHAGQGNGKGSVFADNGRMRLEPGGTSLYPVCNVIDFNGEQEANARLIAAAPDLLESLSGLIAAIKLGISIESMLACADMPGSYLARAEAAIAKVEGKV